MRRYLLCAILTGMASPAIAQQPRVPVPIHGGSNDGTPACSTAHIYDLRPSDPYLAVRAGPSRRDRQLARLRNGDEVFACVRDGDWFGIVFRQPDGPLDCGVMREWPASRPYAGPCRSGWVHHAYIGGYADWISP